MNHMHPVHAIPGRDLGADGILRPALNDLPRRNALSGAKLHELARKIAAKSSMTLAAGKRACYAQREMPLSAACDHAVTVMVDNMLAHDAEEGIGAFIEKRAPAWQDR